MGDYIALAVVVIIVAAAVIYLIRQKKSGVKCIGCPHANMCSSKSHCSCSDKAQTK